MKILVRLSSILSGGVLLVVMACHVGCEDYRLPVTAHPPAFVKFKTWYIIADNEYIEEEGVAPWNRKNKGCRFTFSEMAARMRQLFQHAHLYGPNVQFWGDPELSEIRSSELRLQPPELGRVMSEEMFERLVLAYHDDDAINIYFAGTVRNETLIGTTKEPGNQYTYIILNDCGRNLPQGFHHLPDVSFKFYVLIHEMTHYFARFRDTCYPRPYGNRCYDNGEHVNFQHRHDNILKDHPFHLDLVIPGDFDDLNTEKGQIWKRIRDGEWNDP